MDNDQVKSLKEKLNYELDKNKKIQKISRSLLNNNALAEAEGNQMMVHIHKDPITRKMIADDVSHEEHEDPEKIVEEEVDKIVIDISDMGKINQLVNDLHLDLKDSVIGSLPNDYEITRMKRSFEIYENLDTIRKNFYMAKMRIEEKTDYIQKIVEFSLDYALNHEDKEDWKKMLSDKEVELNEHNKEVLIILLDKLKEKVDILHQEIFENLNSIFEEYTELMQKENKTSSELAGKMIETSIKITIFENNVIEKLIPQILKINDLVIDNPKYDHISHLFDHDFEPPEDEETKDEENKKKELDKITTPKVSKHADAAKNELLQKLNNQNDPQMEDNDESVKNISTIILPLLILLVSL